ncbi:MAG: four helix bundle protein [Alphaproteobacteria bacterium]|jgi:four helix bundle protein
MTSEPLRTPAIAAARAYETLPAWQKAMSLAEALYAATEDFPAREQNGLALVLRQSATYVASAIAAGSAGRDEEDITDYYREAQSALAEVATQVALAQRLGLINKDSDVNAAIDELTRLLIGLQHGLKVKAKDDERRARDEARAAHAPRPEARDERPRRDFKPREDRGDRGGDRPYRKPFVKRDDGRGEERPHREFKPREDRGGDRPYRKPFVKRDDARGEERPRREFKPREDRSSTGGGDRPYRKREEGGDRRGYAGGKKPYAKRDFSGKPKRRD